MKPDFIKIAQWLKEIEFFSRKIEEELEGAIKEQRKEYRKYSDDGKTFKEGK